MKFTRILLELCVVLHEVNLENDTLTKMNKIIGIG